MKALKAIYWAEKELAKVGSVINIAATPQELGKAIGEHLTQTEGNVHAANKLILTSFFSKM